jgi:glucans biosynthesis protein
MFFFGPNDRKDVDDFRPSVHDSDGLAIFNGRGEELWRPLHNPRDLQVSSFADLNPRRFRLMQRQKDFAAYQDLESNFERRPSLWAEPIGDWGEGAVKLLEIPNQRRGSTTTSHLSGIPKAPWPARASTPTHIACTGDRMRRSRLAWHDFPGPASAQEATTPRSSCSTSPARS